MKDFLNMKEARAVIEALGKSRTVMVAGENGSGKTAMFYELKDVFLPQGYHVVEPIECTQLSDGSVWMPDVDKEAGVSREVPNERFGVNKTNRLGIDGSKPVLIWLDEFAKAPTYVQNMLAPIVYEHRVGDYRLPEGSIVVCATNLAVEGLGDTIKPHLRNRLVFLKMRKPTAQEWINNFAVPRGLNPVVIAFAHSYPQLFDSFMDYEEGGKFAGQVLHKDNGYIYNPRSTQQAYTSPRSLHTASDVLDTCSHMSADVLEHVLAGTIGAPAAAALVSFVQFGKQLCSFDEVVADPMQAPMPENPAAQIVQMYSILARVSDRDNANAVIKYVERMPGEMQAVFCAAASSRALTIFITLDSFGALLRKHAVLFN